MRTILQAAVSVGVWVLCAWSAMAQNVAAQKMQFRIDAPSMAQALLQFTEQSNLQLAFASDRPSGISAPKVVGQFTPQEALDRLLANTGLTYEFVNERTVRITPPASSGSRSSSGENQLSVVRLAQDGSAAAAQSTAQERASESENRKSDISEVVVTATKRAENVQDVPISIAVVTSDDISRRGLVGAEDYLRGIPGVNQTEVRGFGQSIVVRGIESSPAAQNFGSGATTATYFGEAPTTTSEGLGGGTNIDVKLVDIERVEVLRGPQGTSFGNSSMGGAVRTIPVAPKLDRFEGKVGAGYSMTSGTGGDNHMFQAVGNVPLVRDKLAIRGVAYTFYDSGYYRNRAGSDAAFRAVTVTPFGAEGSATNEDEVGAYRATGGRIAALYQATDQLEFTLSYLKQKNEIDGWGIQNTGSGDFDQAVLRIAPAHVRRGQSGGYSDNDIGIANALMEYDLGWGNLVATYSDVKGGTTQGWPYTYYGTTLGFPASSFVDTPHREHAGEIRLVTRLPGAWNFLAGLFTESHDDTYYQHMLWNGSPATNFFALNTDAVGLYIDRRKMNQKAAFGEVSWQFVPKWTLTAGVRAYEYERDTRVDTSGPAFGGGSSERNKADASGSNFRANLSFKPVDSALLYAGWAQGFRLGRPQPGLPAALCDQDNNGIVDGTAVSLETTRSLRSDSVDSYEVGAKLALLDRRLIVDAAAFRMNWEEIPVLVYLGCAGAVNLNAGSALSEGVELQAKFRVTESVRLDVGGSWIHARLTEDVPAQGFSDGDRLPGSPKVNANLALQYEFDLAGRPAFVRTDAIYVGEFFGNIQQSPNTRSGGYSKVDATARVAFQSLNLDIYVRNLTNENAYAFRNVFSPNPFFGYRLLPRTVGMQISYDF